MSPHNELAGQLGRLYRERKAKAVALDHCADDLAGREAAIVPAEGWPGKNDDARKSARLAALAADETLKAIRANQSKLRDDLADIEGQIEDLEAQRRGLEWTVRERLAEALAGRRETRASVEDAAFDEAPVGAVVEEALPTPLEAGETDDIPF